MAVETTEPAVDFGIPAIGNTLPAIPEWRFFNRNGIDIIERTFKFKNLRSALHFANQVGEMAENEGQHPSLLVEWGKVTVSWWVHQPNNIAVHDYQLASRTEFLAEATPRQ